MRTFAAVFVGGALGLLLLKLAFGLMGTLLGLLFGAVALAVKLLIFGLVAYFIYRLFRGPRHDREERARGRF